MDGWMGGLMDEWMGRSMDGWVNGWMGGSMDGWMDGWTCIHTVDVHKMFTKSFTDHVSIIFHQIRKHELVTSVGGLQCFDVNFL